MNGVPGMRGNPNFGPLQCIQSLEQEVQSLTLHIIRMGRSLAVAIEECNALCETNAALSAHNAFLPSQTKQVQQLKAVCIRFPVLSHHVTYLMQSTNHRTPCYNSKMKPFYILAASRDETLYPLFDCLFDFPAWRQVERYRSRRRNALGLQQKFFVYRGCIFMLSHKGTPQVVQTLASVFASTPYPIQPAYSSLHILARLLGWWSPWSLIARPLTS
jgi:hypothetical protein